MPFPDLPLSTPSLLFPAISLLMLAHTNRFLGLASVVRALHATWRTSGDPVLVAQIASLRRRIGIIKKMQALGIVSILLCTFSMAFIFLGYQAGGHITFALSLASMTASLILSLREIQLSGTALDLLLHDVGVRPGATPAEFGVKPSGDH
ncbi:MAG: DUF2721 domain-containing protein [Prosthecobacter sp.]|nr:DUF2721 domain-containing protein [Prosthecobacter sp.]